MKLWTDPAVRVETTVPVPVGVKFVSVSNNGELVDIVVLNHPDGGRQKYRFKCRSTDNVWRNGEVLAEVLQQCWEQRQ